MFGASELSGTPRADSDDPIDDVQTWLYIITAVYGFTLIVLIGLVIGLYVWISKIAANENKISRAGNRSEDYKISRPKVHGEAPYKRFTLPPRAEDGVNSDIYYGGNKSSRQDDSLNNIEPMFFAGERDRNPLSQQSTAPKQNSYVDELKHNQSFRDGNNRNSRRNDFNSPYTPSGSDYYSNDRNKFSY